MSHIWRSLGERVDPATSWDSDFSSHEKPIAYLCLQVLGFLAYVAFLVLIAFPLVFWFGYFVVKYWNWVFP